jgi:soluble lytic murein transglycosylase-like protein
MNLIALLLPLTIADAPQPEPAYEQEIAAAVADVEGIHYVPPALVKSIVRVESDFNPHALSHKGAVGLMQVMPFNAARVGLTAPQLWSPASNILAGTRLLAVLLQYYRGDLISALVAYNGRPQKAFAPPPRNGETPRYVSSVLRWFRRYSGQKFRGTIGRSGSAGSVDPDWLLVGAGP